MLEHWRAARERCRAFLRVECDGFLEEASRYARLGRFAEARKSCTDCLEQDWNNLGAFLTMAEIELQIADYALRAQERKLELSELTGATFTISNGGIFGSMLSTPILNPPGSAILGMHAIKKRPVVVDDEIVVRPMMYLALSYDHRLIDGREAVTFLRRTVEVIENPERMLLEI